jgi:hypothetical protein
MTTDPHAYHTTAPPGVRRVGWAYEVVGANGRRILVYEAPEGVYVGSVLVNTARDLLALADLLTEVAGRALLGLDGT